MELLRKPCIELIRLHTSGRTRTAHEYLAVDNHAYARRTFMDLMARYDLAYVADADFNYVSGRVPEGLPSRLASLGIDRDTIAETVDLLCYRQLHSPILTQRGFTRRPADRRELSGLIVASCLVEGAPNGEDGVRFQHPCGYEVRAQRPMVTALRALQPLWPRGLPIGDLFRDASEVIDDLALLHRNGLLELRVVDAAEFRADPETLNRLESCWGDHVTTRYHTVERPGK